MHNKSKDRRPSALLHRVNFKRIRHRPRALALFNCVQVNRELQELRALIARAPDANLAQPEQLHTALLSTTSVRCHTFSVFPKWQQMHSQQVAQSCVSTARSPSNVRICTLYCFAALYIKCLLPSPK